MRVRDPMENAAYILQLFNHLQGTIRCIGDGQQYLKTLAAQLAEVGASRTYIDEGIKSLAKIKADLLTDAEDLGKKLSKISIS